MDRCIVKYYTPENLPVKMCKIWSIFNTSIELSFSFGYTDSDGGISESRNEYHKNHDAGIFAFQVDEDENSILMHLSLDQLKVLKDAMIDMIKSIEEER